MVVADGGSAEGLVSKLVLRQQCELLRGGLEDGGDAAFARDVDARVGHDGGAVEFAVHFLRPQLFTRGGFPAGGT